MVKERLFELIDSGYFGYHDEDQRLGVAFAQWAKARNNWNVDPNLVVATVTVLQGLSACVEVCSSKGEAVLYATPAYPPFLELPELADRRSITWSLTRTEGGWEYDFDLLESILKSEPTIKILILCNPQNPTGLVLEKKELEKIVELAHRYDFYIISDEIHSDFIFNDSVHVPTLKIDGAESKTITVTSAAKSFALAGLRCAIAIPGDINLKNKLTELPKFLLGGANRIGCEATITAWENGSSWMDQLLDLFDSNRHHLVHRLKNELPKACCYLPNSTFLSWIDFSNFNPGKDPADWLRTKARVACGNGPDFGIGGENHLRLTFGTSKEFLDLIIDRIVNGVSLNA